MRRPSRQMPRDAAPAVSWYRSLLAGAFLVLLVVGAGVAVWTRPWLLLLIPTFWLAYLIDSRIEEKRLAPVREARREESICSFARSVDCRSRDTWVVRAVYEELRDYLGFDFRPDDDLFAELRVDEEDFEFDLLPVISRRCGRALKAIDGNPLLSVFQNQSTARTLIGLLEHQPRTATEHASG